VRDELPLLVLDASVVINLNATDRAAGILDALPFQAAVTDVVESELLQDRRTGRKDGDLLAELVAAQRIAIMTLDETAISIFGGLIAGSTTETLDDGEAATIAVAVTHGAVAVIDESKARSICSRRFRELRLLSTAEMFLRDEVASALGSDDLSNAVFCALHTARMRVLPEYAARIVQLIGTDRALKCPSLPKTARPR
jgi:predicted nucleic acid-binding protein